MSNTAPDPEQSAAEMASDPAVLRAERRLRVLEEMTEIGLRLMRALERRVLAEDEAAEASNDEPTARAKDRDPAAAFSQLSRAIRLTLALEAKTDEALRALKAGVVLEHRETVERDRKANLERWSEREQQVKCLILDAARGDVREDADWERLDRDLDERLLLDDDFWSDPDQPLREIVERYCQYFSLSPDWSRWDGEGWMQDDPPLWPWAAARDADPASPPTCNGAHALE